MRNRGSLGIGSLLLVLLATAAFVPSAGARSERTVALKIGDSVIITGTPIQCVAIHSNGKDGIGCLLWDKTKPVDGSYTAGLATDGSAVISKITGNTSKKVIRRGPASARAAGAVYKLGVKDIFGMVVSSKITLVCEVVNVTSKSVSAAYRGVKVSCWRTTSTGAIPKSWAISISSKFAGVFQFDAKGNVSNVEESETQP